LNIAYMALGEYPHKVPPRLLIPLDGFQSTLDVGRFVNVATRADIDNDGNLTEQRVLSTNAQRPPIESESHDVRNTAVIALKWSPTIGIRWRRNSTNPGPGASKSTRPADELRQYTVQPHNSPSE
jgi:hypothetical protein